MNGGGRDGFKMDSSLSQRKEWGFWGIIISTSQEDVAGAMAFFLKPRPCTWDLALDYHTAKQFEGNQKQPERSKVPIPDVFWAASSAMSIEVGHPPAPPSISLDPPSPASISWFLHVQPQLEILHLQPPSLRSSISNLTTPLPFSLKMDVTLDPATAGPEVILSEDLKEASWGRPGRRWPEGPGQFDTDPCMLGSEGFTSGRHYWEVEANGRFWAVGVARESVQRKGRILFKPNTEIWGLQKYDELCVALTAPSNTSVPLLNGEIGVYLDYEVGQVSFYAVGSRQRIFTFPVASFSGEKVFPYFCVLLSTIKLSPKG
ncbi:butyrophilin subfamily 1 member A1 [Haliaeetus albicilla]|uniref:butyrophilin subfamily 1 member A1 n=1 Tax=Haliaeetus albicilla TaxID=8969 RepID=UPI0037E74F81